MPVELKPGVRYDMPAAFGPSAAVPVTRGYRVVGVSVPFLTERGAVARFLPRWFEPAERPLVTVTYQRCLGMDWMGGRNYNIVSVYLAVNGVGLEREISAPYGLVIWESDAAPVVSGREYMGTPKIHARIPDLEIPAPSLTFECAEYDATLVRGEITGMARVEDQERLAQLNRAGEEICRLHWKYIPGLEGEPDADYPVAMYTRATYTEVWEGEGAIEFGTPDRIEAPYSAAIGAALAELPVLERHRAVATVASGVDMFRDRTERLHSA